MENPQGPGGHCAALKCLLLLVCHSEHGWPRARLLCPSITAFPPQCCLPLPLCSSTHERPCLTKAIARSFTFTLYDTEAFLPWFLTILQSQTCLSSPVTPQIQSCFPSTFLPHLTAPQLLLLVFAYFKRQQKSWFRAPGLINVDTTNTPSLGTDWRGWSPPEVRDEMILWRCLPLKQFLFSWKSDLSILLPKKLQMFPSKRNQPAALLISTITPYRTYKTRACVMSNQYFSCEHGTNALNH